MDYGCVQAGALSSSKKIVLELHLSCLSLAHCLLFADKGLELADSNGAATACDFLVSFFPYEPF